MASSFSYFTAPAMTNPDDIKIPASTTLRPDVEVWWRFLALPIRRCGARCFPYPVSEVTMLKDGSWQRKKTWEELASAAVKETDPEKIATIVEEIFAALEERQRTLSQAH